MTNLTPSELQAEIEAAEATVAELGDRERRLWGLLRIPPEQWEQRQYPGEELIWVVAVIGRRCLYYNHLEEGWGWGGFETWGAVDEYHYQQDEIQHAVHQILCLINGVELLWS